MQLLSGLLLLLNYNALERYEAIQFIVYEVNYGWLLKIFHGNNAGFIFLVAYGHISKNLSVFGYRFRGVWLRGVVILVLLIGAAFTGYALVGRQMSYWAVIVITGLAGVVPYLGETLLHGIWGGYSLSWVTFQTLIVVHFVLPFMVLGIIIVHLSILHVSGRTNLNFTHSGCHKVRFYPYY
jgi:ubiquinol-cytochrome c reductase cytochrome b subunit